MHCSQDHQVSLTLNTNVPVVYLDSVQELVRVHCNADGQIALTASDMQFVSNFRPENFLFVLGHFGSMCPDHFSPFRLVKSWTSNATEGWALFHTIDAQQGGVVGTYGIEVYENPERRRNVSLSKRSLSKAPRLMMRPEIRSHQRRNLDAGKAYAYICVTEKSN
jgi:hypothetical protein